MPGMDSQHSLRKQVISTLEYLAHTYSHIQGD